MSNQPPWSRLPHDPRGFFGLEPGFDRRDLKRAYNQLARRFRPDQAPEEFRSIRAAYEALELFLQQGSMPRTQPVETTSHPPTGTSLSTPPRDADLKANDGVIERLCRGDHDGFWRDLLDALARFPESQALLRTLYESYREPPSVSPALLEDLAARRPADEVLVDANPIWSSLLATHDPGTVVATFERIARGVDPDSMGLLLLRIYLTRRLLLTGNPGWLRRQLDELEQRWEEIPAPFQSRLSGFDAILKYRDVREEFLAAEPTARELDRFIALYADRPPHEVFPQLANYLGTLRERSESLAHLEGSVAAGADEFVDVLLWLIPAAAQRLGSPGSIGSELGRGRRIDQWSESLIQTLKTGGPRGWRRLWWRMSLNRFGRLLLLAGFTLLLLMPIYVVATEDPVSRGDLGRTVALCSVLAALPLLWARRYFRDAWQASFFEEMVPEIRVALYEEVIAPRTYEFLANERISPDELLEFLSERPQGQHWALSWLGEYVGCDLVALIQRF